MQEPQQEARIAATINNWKRKLLDISKRNRALSFRPTKVTTVRIVDEQPAEVFRQLYIQERAMRFHPAAIQTPQPATLFADQQSEDELQDIGAAAQSQELNFTPYATESLGAHHTDDALQTSLPAEKLDQALRRIDEQARASLEEQGVNTLFLALGMLYYKESANSEIVLAAPLLMLPVKLSRNNARAGYKVWAAEEEPIVNPALAEYLRRSFDILLPELPDLATIADTYDLQHFFLATGEAISGQAGWQVKREIYLSFFSFQKFMMYKDLDANSERFSAHPLIRQVILHSGEALRALPDEVRAARLDEEFAPESTAQVTNADASQLRAILAASRNHSLVIEGPPGTGKSQTITNLIAQALAQEKSVLFVAEKMAALEVVHNRLVEAGLGEFCLELHATKVNKRAVMQEIATALDASLQVPPVTTPTGNRLASTREELTAYTNAVHLPFAALGISPYQGFAAFERVRNAPKLKFTQPVADITREILEATERDLGNLAAAAQPLGALAEHPWRDTTRTFYTEQDLDALADLLTTLGARLAHIQTLATQAEQDFSLPPIRGFAELRVATVVADVLARSPGAPLTVLQSEMWNSPPPQAIALIEQGRVLNRRQSYVERRFTAEAFLHDHTDDIAFIEAKENSLLRFLNFLNGRFRAIKQRWVSYRFPGYQPPTLRQQAADLRKVDALQRERRDFATQDALAQQLFGALWQGENSNWESLNAYIHWVTEFRKVCLDVGLKEQAIVAATKPRADVSLLTNLEAEATQARRELADLRAQIGWQPQYLADASFAVIAERVQQLKDKLSLAPRWASFERLRAKVAAGLAAELLEAAMREEISFADLTAAWRRAFFLRWLNDAIRQREVLQDFSALTHEQRVAEFKRLDEETLLANRSRLVRQLRHRTQEQLRAGAAFEALPFLRGQLTRQRGLRPLRETFKHSLAAIRVIKPVFMMSPLSVAQLLSNEHPPFDLVIFDEASQLPTEDAVGAMARGRQLIVVGDPKQLPPTNFFSVMSGAVTAPLGEDGIPLFEDSQSILEEFMGSGAAMARLKWHYRSAHESLISFSNVSFYEGDLYTFPSVETDSHASGLGFEYLPDGVYEGKGINPVEARRVADAVVRHAKTHPELSLGVGTFNLRQQLVIQDELEMRRRQDPALEPFFARDRREPFFVKNLENIQGDERDVIFLSVTYAKDANGVLRHNFGPLNNENGWKRLNVLITRARRKMRVFSSMKGDEINLLRVTSQGPQFLRDFLHYAEHGRLSGVRVNLSAETESPFEHEVYMELTRRGLQLQPQVGVAGYRIDLAVIDESSPGRFLCGIECDGATYHSSETARDRDRLRQQVLEERGWTIHRVWSTDWFKDHSGQIERLLNLIEQTRQARQIEQAAEAEARQRDESVVEQTAREETAEDQNLVAKTDLSPTEPLATSLVQAQTYIYADTPLLYPGQDFHAAPAAYLARAIADVVAVEAPLHLRDLAARVVARWGYNVVGPSMLRKIRTTVEEQARQQKLLLSGDFILTPTTAASVVRSRAGTGIPADRIAPEEYRAAVLLVLQAGDGLDRRRLTNKVRALFGFARTGAALDSAINRVIDGLLTEGIIGEGATGIRLRS